jgi:excisionase family DNA binding protein
MKESTEPARQSLERAREALERVQRVLQDLGEVRQHAGTPPTEHASVDRLQSNGDKHDRLRAHEVARLLNISVKEVYAAVRDRRLAAHRLGRFLWFRRADVGALDTQLRAERKR